MTLFKRSRLLRVSPLPLALAAVWALGLAACGSPAASNGVVVSPTSATEPSAAEPSNEPASEKQSVDPVDLVVKRELWPLEPDAAEELLSSLGQVRRETPVSYELSLVGGPAGMVERFEVSYSQGDDGRWTFDAAGFFLGGVDLPALYQKLEARIVERLGKPEWTNKQSDLPSSGWSLGRDMSLLLAPSPNGGERLVMMSVSEPDGEAE